MSDGLSFTGSYSLAKDTSDSVAADETGRLQPFVPAGYLSGRSANDRRHMLWFNAVYELPFGRDKRFLNDDASGGQRHPGRVAVERHQQLRLGRTAQHRRPGRDAGQRVGHAAPISSGDPNVSDPSATQWFNTAAFSAPAQFEYGNSPIGVIEGPAAHILDLGLMKNFSIGGGKYIQVRAEAYNALNKVNLGNPGTTLGTANFGRILSAGAARTMQFGVKFVF